MSNHSYGERGQDPHSRNGILLFVVLYGMGDYLELTLFNLHGFT
jgi:hypothetical protein